MDAWFAGPEGPQALFAGHVLAFEETAALLWARLMAEGKANGRPRSALAPAIAAIAQANQCIVVTDNDKDFADIEIVNPLRESGCLLPGFTGFFLAGHKAITDPKPGSVSAHELKEEHPPALSPWLLHLPAKLEEAAPCTQFRCDGHARR